LVKKDTKPLKQHIAADGRMMEDPIYFWVLKQGKERRNGNEDERAWIDPKEVRGRRSGNNRS